MPTPRDIKEFLDGYPGNEDDPRSSENLKFYTNNLRCRPDNCLIDEIHDQWLGDYNKLENKHGYIQWLFPIRERGMNFQSQQLQPHEIQTMKSDPLIVGRIIKSYKLMLDFYGMRLISVKSGLIGRSLPPRNYASRYRNIVRASHNNLRISRILKCLSEFGFEHLNIGFLLHVLCEQSELDELNSNGIRDSMDRWWANCIRNNQLRQWVGDTIKKARLGAGGYVFTRDLYTDAIENMINSTGALGN